MKFIILGLVSILLFVSPRECSPSDRDPQFRVRNERNNIAMVQFHSSGGTILDFYNIQPGNTTAYLPVSEGIVVATAYIRNERSSPSVTLMGENYKKSTIVIRSGEIPFLYIDQ